MAYVEGLGQPKKLKNPDLKPKPQGFRLRAYNTPRVSGLYVTQPKLPNSLQSSGTLTQPKNPPEAEAPKPSRRVSAETPTPKPLNS